HLVVEAADEVGLARGLQGFAVWTARRLNAVMNSRGTVFADRYHAHQLRSLAEARDAIRYVVENYDEHARRRGEAAPDNVTMTARRLPSRDSIRRASSCLPSPS